MTLHLNAIWLSFRNKIIFILICICQVSRVGGGVRTYVANLIPLSQKTETPSATTSTLIIYQSPSPFPAPPAPPPSPSPPPSSILEFGDIRDYKYFYIQSTRPEKYIFYFLHP